MTTRAKIAITGTSRGIGLALAHEFLDRGHEVWGCARSTPSLDHANYTHVTADLSDDQDSARAAASLPAIELLVLNAGILGRFGDLQETSLDDLRHTLQVNLWGQKPIIDAALAHAPGPTQVVAISSGASVSGSRGWAGYALSKAALNMMMQLYAAEAPDTHFAALAPGTIDTAMQDTLCAHPETERFPTLEVLRRKRRTPDMPGPTEAAPALIDFIASLPDRCASGAFVDIRRAADR